MKPNRIAYLRKKRGMSMQKLAAKVGTSQQQIDRLEKGKRRLTVDWMQRLSDALSCNMMDLLNQVEKERDVQNTARAKVIGAISFSEDGLLSEYEEKDMYALLFSRPKRITSPRLFALVVANGNEYFPQGAELILSEVARTATIEEGQHVLCAARNGQYFLRRYPEGCEGAVIKAKLVKLIQDVL